MIPTLSGFKMPRLILFVVLATSLISILITTRNADAEEAIAEECASLKVVDRKAWGAVHDVPKLNNIRRELSPWMMVHHTAGKSCSTTEECKHIIKEIETYEMKEQNAKEILSHFFIGGDGQIYEGRGWYYPDEYIPGYGLVLSVSFIGDYRKQDAPEIMLEALEKFIACFMKKVAGYCQHVFSAHDDHRCTDCPGSNLKLQLQKSKHYDHSKSTRPCERHREYVQMFYEQYKKDPHQDHHHSYIYDKSIMEKYKQDPFLSEISYFNKH